MILAVKGLIFEKGKLLLLQRNPMLRKESNWDLPGGLVEENESEIVALKREVKEEINQDIEIKRKSGQWSFKRAHDDQIIIVNNYLCHLIISNEEITLSPEHVSFKWINPFDIIKFKLKDNSLAEAILKEFAET